MGLVGVEHSDAQPSISGRQHAEEYVMTRLVSVLPVRQEYMNKGVALARVPSAIIALNSVTSHFAFDKWGDKAQCRHSNTALQPMK